MKPTISVIIPVYNVEPYLRACLDSVLAQTYSDFEVICVDDGSTDKSSGILDQYASTDNRVKVIHQANGGIAVARNAGLALAKSELIYFMDSDDVIVCDLFERVHRLAQARPFEFLCFDSISFSSRSSDFPPQDEPCVDAIDTSRVISAKVYERGVWQCFFRKSLIGELRYPDGCIRGEDRLFLGTYLSKCRQCLYLPYVGYAYRQVEGSIMHRVLDARMLADELWHRVELFRRVCAAGKCFDVPLSWRLTVNLLEWYPAEVFKLSVAVWRPMYEKWRAAIREFDQMGFAWTPRWRRVVAAPAVYIRSLLLWRLCCALPHTIRNCVSYLFRNLHLKG